MADLIKESALKAFAKKNRESTVSEPSTAGGESTRDSALKAFGKINQGFEPSGLTSDLVQGTTPSSTMERVAREHAPYEYQEKVESVPAIFGPAQPYSSTMERIAREERPEKYQEATDLDPTKMLPAITAGMDTGVKQLGRSFGKTTELIGGLTNKYIDKYRSLTEDYIDVPDEEYGRVTALFESIEETGRYFKNEPLFKIDKEIEGKYNNMSMIAPERALYTGFSAVPQIMASFLAGGALAARSADVVKAFAIGQSTAFGTLASGSYAHQAEQEGASMEEQLAYGVVMGAVEVATEAPYFKYLNNFIGTSGIMRGANQLAKLLGTSKLATFGASLGYEATQEAVAEVLGGISSKLIYDEDKPWTGQGGALDPAAIGQAAYSGAAMGMVIGGMAAPFQSSAHKQARETAQNMAEGKEMTPEQATKLVREIKNAEDAIKSVTAFETIRNQNMLKNDRPVQGKELMNEEAAMVIDTFNKVTEQEAVQSQMGNEKDARLVDTMSRALGFQYIVVEGKGLNVNGFYDVQNDTIVINKNSEKPAMQIVGHEVAHRMQKRSPEAYGKLLVAMSENAVPGKLESLKKEITKQYGEMSDAQLTSEVVARYSEELFQNPAILEDIISVEPSLAAKVMKHIEDIVNTIKKSGLKAVTEISDIFNNADKVREQYVESMQEHVQSEMKPIQDELTEFYALRKDMQDDGLMGTEEYDSLVDDITSLENELAGVKLEYMYDLMEEEGKKKEKAQEKETKKETPKKKESPQKGRATKAQREADLERARKLTQKRQERVAAELLEVNQKKLRRKLKTFDQVKLSKVDNNNARNIIRKLEDAFMGKEVTYDKAVGKEIIDLLNTISESEDAFKENERAQEITAFEFPKEMEKTLKDTFKKDVSDMTYIDFGVMNNFLDYIERHDEVYRKLIAGDKLTSLDIVLQEVMGQMQNATGVDLARDMGWLRTQVQKRFNLGFQPENLLLRMTGWEEDTPFMNILYDSINDGQIRGWELRFGLLEMVNKETKLLGLSKKDLTKMSLRSNRKKARFDNGVIPLNPMEKVMLHLYASQKKGRQHLRSGGLAGLNSKDNLEIVKSFTERDIRYIRTGEFLTEKERGLANIYKKHYRKELKDWINEASMRNDGFKRANEDDYAGQLRTYRANKEQMDIARNEEGRVQTFRGRMELSGYLTPRVKNPTTPLLRTDAKAEFIRAVKFGAEYNGLSTPLRNARMLIGNGELRTLINERYGAKAAEQIDKYLNDVELGADNKMDAMDKAFRKVQRNFTTAKLGTNLSVSLKQTASITNALAYIEYGPWVPKGMADLKMDPKMLKDGVVQVRMAGGGMSRETHDAMNVGSMANETTAAVAEAAQLGMTPIHFMDMRTITAIWNILREEQRIKTGEVDYNKLKRDFHRNVFRSQPNYASTQRSQFMRKKELYAKAFTMFRTQLETNWNMLYRDVAVARKTGKYGQLAKTMSHQITGQLYIALITTFWATIRDYDDEHEYWKQFILAMAGIDLFSSHLAGWILERWEETSPIMEAVNSVRRTVKLLADDPLDDPAKSAKQIIDTTSMMTGVSASNVIKTIEDVFHLGRGTLDTLK